MKETAPAEAPSDSLPSEMCAAATDAGPTEMTRSLTVPAEAASEMTLPLVVLTAFATIGGFLFGYDTGVVSGAEVFIRDDLGLSNGQIQLVVSITVGVAAVGSACSGVPMQRYGRRPIIMLASALYTAGSCVIAVASGFEMLLLGRLILGLGVGLSSMAIPVRMSVQ